MRVLIGCVLTVVIACPLAGQSRRAPKLAHATQVDGWMMRIDPSAERSGAKPADAQLTGTRETLQLTSTAPAVYFSVADTVTGRYQVFATITQRRGTQPVYAGVFMGGSQLEGAAVNYLYCAVAGNGTFVVFHRIGDEVHELAGRTMHAAVKKASAEGRGSNQVGWRVTPERTACVVNGAEVWGYASPSLVGAGKLESINGIAGLRADRGADLEVTGFSIERR